MKRPSMLMIVVLMMFIVGNCARPIGGVIGKVVMDMAMYYANDDMAGMAMADEPLQADCVGEWASSNSQFSTVSGYYAEFHVPYDPRRPAVLTAIGCDLLVDEKPVGSVFLCASNNCDTPPALSACNALAIRSVDVDTIRVNCGTKITPNGMPVSSSRFAKVYLKVTR